MRTVRTRRLCFTLLVLALPRLASANAAAPPRPPSLSAVGAAAAKTELVVDSATLRIDCKGSDACALEVHYSISNPTDAELGGTAAFYGRSTFEIKVNVDGAPANVGIDEQAGAAFDASVEQASEGRRLYGMGSSDRQGFAVSVAPHATAKVVVTGTLVPNMRRGYDGFAPMADRARHMALTPDAPKSSRLQLEYMVAPIRTWGAVPKDMAFTFVHPAGWDPSVHGADDLRVSTASDGRTVREGKVPTTIDSLSIDVDLGEVGQRIRGGVFAGIGGNVDDATGVRMRVGGELAWRRSYLTSLALEVETGSPTSYVIIPAVHAATPWIVIIPSLGAGVGVPMRVSPTFEVGGRIQLDAHFGPIGYFVAFDWYPGMEAGPRRFEVAMMAQLSI